MGIKFYSFEEKKPELKIKGKGYGFEGIVEIESDRKLLIVDEAGAIYLATGYLIDGEYGWWQITEQGSYPLPDELNIVLWAYPQYEFSEVTK